MASDRWNMTKVTDVTATVTLGLKSLSLTSRHSLGLMK